MLLNFRIHVRHYQLMGNFVVLLKTTYNEQDPIK